MPIESYVHFEENRLTKAKQSKAKQPPSPSPKMQIKYIKKKIFPFVPIQSRMDSVILYCTLLSDVSVIRHTFLCFMATSIIIIYSNKNIQQSDITSSQHPHHLYGTVRYGTVRYATAQLTQIASSIQTNLNKWTTATQIKGDIQRINPQRSPSSLPALFHDTTRHDTTRHVR